MKRTHPAFWGAGLAGLVVGGLLAIIGVVDTAETSRLAGGYGLMLMGSAVWLLGGLGLRETLGRRSASHRRATPTAGQLPRGIPTAN